MKARSLLGSLAFIAASMLNPAYFAGCGKSEQFEFEAEDVLALLDTANGSFETEVEGVSYRVELELAPAPAPAGSRGADSYGGSPWARGAFACSNRQLVASASACSDSSTMNLIGSVTVTRLGSEERVIYEGPIERGSLEVFGLKLDNGYLAAAFEDGSIQLNSRDGKSFDAEGLQLSFRPGTR